MTPKFWLHPKVTLISKPQFFEPAHMPVEWVGTATDAGRLVEFSGRMCYMSQKNASGRDNEAYIDNVLSGGHGSVIEHANFSLLLEGVSRTLTHELIRHRAGMAYSELSQRFVSMEDASFVIPPAILGTPEAQNVLQTEVERALVAYDQLTEQLIERFKAEAYLSHDPTLRRKRAREAARSVLPNCTETKIVATGNARAWRHIIALRASEHADLEIQRLFKEVWKVLAEAEPNLFGDFSLQGDSLVPSWPKV